MAASAWTPVDESTEAWKPVAEAATASSGISAEQQQFLKEKSGYQYFPADPKFPNRPEGIYPTGPGNEWRQHPDFAQEPVDLHLGQHTYEGAKAGAMAATAPLALGATLPQLAGGAAGATVGTIAGQAGAKKLGAGEFEQEVAGDVGGVVGGGIGGGAADWAMQKAVSLYKAMPGPVQKALLGVLSPRAKEAIELADALGIGAKTKTAATPEVEQAKGLATGGQPYRDPAAALQNIPTAKPTTTPSTPPAAPVSTADIGAQLNDALGGKPLVPGVALKNQPAAMAAKLPEGFTPVESSSVLKGYKYDPAAKEFTAITNGGQSYTHGEVTPDQVAAFEGADSKGSAWTKEIRDNSPLVRKNGVPVKPIASATAEPGESQPAAQPQPKAAAAAVGAGGEGDLTSLLQQSLDQIKVPKGGVSTSVDPAELTKRWGVDEESLARGREQTRGMAPGETESELQRMTQLYKNGAPVQPLMETRDAANNIVSVDGRGRAIAAQRAGVKRIPIIVRRLQ